MRPAPLRDLTPVAQVTESLLPPEVPPGSLASGEADAPLIVDLAGAASLSDREVAAAAAAMRDSRTVAIGVASGLDVIPAALLEAATLTVAPKGCGLESDRRVVVAEDVSQCCDDISRAFADNPVASTLLVQTLRINAELSIDDGILVESFAYSALLGGVEFAAWLAARGPARPGRPAAPQVLVQRVGDRLDATLNQPERRNAYSATMRDALVEALLVPIADPSITEVTLRGNGPSFCSGGDLAEFGTTADTALTHLIRTTRSVGWLLWRLGSRAHVHIHGACIGAGIEIPAFAAHVTAAPDAVMRLPEVAMGLIPGAGGTASITARVGRWRTAYLGLTGHPLDARTAHDWGLVDDIVEV